mgnify:CR=1 FL=1
MHPSAKIYAFRLNLYILAASSERSATLKEFWLRIAGIHYNSSKKFVSTSDAALFDLAKRIEEFLAFDQNPLGLHWGTFVESVLLPTMER